MKQAEVSVVSQLWYTSLWYTTTQLSSSFSYHFYAKLLYSPCCLPLLILVDKLQEPLDSVQQQMITHLKVYFLIISFLHEHWNKAFIFSFQFAVISNFWQPLAFFNHCCVEQIQVFTNCIPIWIVLTTYSIPVILMSLISCYYKE